MSMTWGYCELCRQKHGWPPKVLHRVDSSKPIVEADLPSVLIQDAPRPQYNGLWTPNRRVFDCDLCSANRECYLTYTRWTEDHLTPKDAAHLKAVGDKLWEIFYRDHGDTEPLRDQSPTIWKRLLRSDGEPWFSWIWSSK